MVFLWPENSSHWCNRIDGTGMPKTNTLSDQAIPWDGPVSYIMIMMRGWFLPGLDPKLKTDYWLNIWNVSARMIPCASFSSNSFFCFSRAQKKLSCSLEDLRSESVDKVSLSVSTRLLLCVQHSGGTHRQGPRPHLVEAFMKLIGRQ